MHKYIKLSDMSQESREKYQAKRKRIDEKRRDKEQVRNYERHGQKWGLDPAICEIVMIDGEADDDGHYNLYQAYSPLLGLRTLQAKPTEGRLGIFACARFLLRLQRELRRTHNKRAKFIAFAYGYDIAQQLSGERNMTDAEKFDVWRMRSRSWGAVRGPNFKPDIYIERARASIQIGRKTGYVAFGKPERHQARVAWQDMFSLFAKGLVSVLEEYSKFWTQEEHALYDVPLQEIKAGKEARGKFAEMGYTDEEVAEKYQLPELQLMHWLVTKIQTLCKEVELYPKSFAGPAPIARSLMYKYGVTSHIKPANYDSIEFQEGPINEIIKRSFFGGNIQSAVSGLLPSGYHTYDINSAHPSQIVKLPCGAHGYWRDLTLAENHQIDQGKIIPYAIYHIAWRSPHNVKWGPFPVRRADNSIVYPLSGEGYYCYQEIAAFLDCYPTTKYDIIDGIVWVPTCNHEHPFAEMINTTYNERNAYKKVKHPAGNILKLAMNSTFGVMAQTAGSYRIVDENRKTTGYSTPKLSNLFLAALITAGTRADIMRMVAKDPSNVFAIATDAVKCYNEIGEITAVDADDKTTDRPLGGLEHEQHTGACIISAPGFIGHESGGDKFRGVPSKCTWWVGSDRASNLFNAQLQAIKLQGCTITARFDKFQSPFDIGTNPEDAGKFKPSDRIIDITVEALKTKRDPKRAVQIGEYLWYCPPYLTSRTGASKRYERPMDRGAVVFERPDRMET